MTDNILEEVQSPCIGVCAMDEISGMCHGCYRTIDEIRAWWDMSVTEQKELLAVLEKRQSASFD